MEEQDDNIKVNAMLLRAMKHLESNRNDGMDVQTMMIQTTLKTKRGGNRLRERKGTVVDSSSSALAQSVSKSKSFSTTKNLSKVTLNELKQRARKAREGYVLSEKAILAGGDRETKFGYCLMYLNAIQKSVNDMCLGGVHFDERRRRRRYPWEAFDEPDDEDDLEKKRVKRKKQNEEREREKKLKKKEETTLLGRKEARGGGVMKVEEDEEEDAKALAPLTMMANTKSPRKRGAEEGEENVVVDDERTTTNKKPMMAVKIIKPGRYPGEYCQLCGEHEHMVHVKYESQVLGEGKLVCYGCLTKEKKELEKKQRELTSAKERQKRKELTKARRKIETITVTSPTTTPNTTTTHSYSSPPSGAPNAVALPQQQSSSPISVADVLVVDGETVTPTATTRTTDVALHTAEKIEAIHDISIVCDRCGKDSFRAAGELERHKTTQCIMAKTTEVIISDSLIETAVTTTTTSENEEAKQGERDGDNVGKIIVANAIANIISEEGEANEKQQQDNTREIREEAFERLREQNLSREEVKNEELIDKEEERGKEETTVFVDVNTAADVPRKGCQSSSHKSEKRRELPLAEILHIAKDGFPFTKHASSGNISPPSVVISDSIHENTINTIEPANLEQEEQRRKAPVSPLDENKEDKKKRLSGPSMKESDERVREMKEWRTENVHALHHGY